MRSQITVFVSLLLFIFPERIKAQAKLFSLLPPDSTAVFFNNIVLDDQRLNVISYEYFYNGAGVSAGDVNHDGLPDLYFTSNVGDCKLYLNKGNLKFEDITDKAGVNGGVGYKTGAVMVDINNDGWMDIYVCRSVAKDAKQRRNLLYINNQNGTFTDRALEYGVADEGYSMSAYFNDMDNDGDLDLLVLNHPYNLDFAKTVHLAYNKQNQLEAVKDIPTPYESDQYYENVNGKFVNRTKQAGLETRAFGLSALLEDFNNDGLIDIYQANDYLEPDYLFINRGNGRFVNEFDNYFKHCSYSTMGTDFADINNDGLSDLIGVDMLPEGNYRQKQLRRANNYDEFDKLVKYGFGYQYVKNVMQKNNGNGSFSDISYYSGLAYSDWSWGVLINDFDNDGLKDVYIANGSLRDITDMDFVKFKMDSIKKQMIKAGSREDVLKLLSIIPSYKVVKNYYKNYGDFRFQKESRESGLEQPAWSFGCAYADLDNDGDLEIIVNNANDYAFIYRNNSVESGINHSVSVKLNGPEKNRQGFGARIHVVTPDGVDRYYVANTMKGYLSNNDDKIVAGIGKNERATVTITWPDGKLQEKIVKAGEQVSLDHAEAEYVHIAGIVREKIFRDITVETKIDHLQKENPYIDFKLEPLLPHRFSQLGPAIHVADLDGDGLEDLVVAGAKDMATSIYFQQKDGSFIQRPQPAFEADKKYEDGSITSYDIDKDGDPDLVITSGGNDHARQETMYPVRFYANDGKGNFQRYHEKYSPKYTSSNAVAVCDYNKDGIMDIFLGGTVMPGQYGLIPDSYLLRIKDSVLQDLTEPILKYIGMVRTAQWADMNGDGWMDLVLAGEWMPISIFYNHDGYLDSAPVVIPFTYGWWNKLVCVDLNGDGKLDIVGGNLGMNTRYTGTPEFPVTMLVNDFDQNGSTDAVISTFVKGKPYPICIRDYMLDQMPFLRKKFLRYSTYSNADVTTLFTMDQLSSSKVYSANEMHSTVFFNQGNNSFLKKDLPPEAQFFPVNGIQVMDINDDGKLDLLLAGNDYSTEVETGRNDAGIGLALTGDGNGNFKALPVTLSGFYVPGDVKSLESITIKGKRSFVAGKNGAKLQLIQIQN